MIRITTLVLHVTQMVCTSVLRTILTWCASSTHQWTFLLRICYAIGTHVARSTHMVRNNLLLIWYAFGTHLVRIWYSYGIHLVRTLVRMLVRIWYAYVMHLVRICYAIYLTWVPAISVTQVTHMVLGGRRLHGVGYCWAPCGERGEMKLATRCGTHLVRINVLRMLRMRYACCTRVVCRFRGQHMEPCSVTHATRVTHCYAQSSLLMYATSRSIGKTCILTICRTICKEICSQHVNSYAQYAQYAI